MTKQSWYNILTENEKKQYENWIYEIEQNYMDEKLVEDTAMENERYFDYFGEF
jgi:heat shock protein HspQ